MRHFDSERKKDKVECHRTFYRTISATVRKQTSLYKEETGHQLTLETHFI